VAKRPKKATARVPWLVEGIKVKIMRSEGKPDSSVGRAPPNTRALIVLNAVLLVLLTVVTLAPAVGAQTRSRGNYAMVAGGVNGLVPSAVYIVDSSNQELIGVSYDYNSKQLNGIGYRNLATDAAEWMRGRPRPGGFLMIRRPPRSTRRPRPSGPRRSSSPR
jgi:hypothetical protein